MQILTKALNGAQIVVETLKKLGVDTLFGYPGGIVLNVYDELYKQDDIKHYLVRHEQAAVHAAEGYARVSGKCGVALVTSGPGATNIVTGVANAYLDGYPLVVITGQVSSELLHEDSFQEVDIVDITKSCTKKAFQVRDINNLENTLKEAFYTAISGKKGPVVVDITKDVFSETADFDGALTYYTDKTDTSPNNINEALNILCSAKRPVIVAGGGAIDSSDELFEFAKILNIPVVNTMMGLGTFSQDDESYMGMVGIFGQAAANQTVRESDVIFAIGARFNDRIRCCFQHNELSRKLIHLDINKNEVSRVVPAAVSLVGDAKSVLKEMISELKTGKYNIGCNKEWLNCVKSFEKNNVQPKKRSDNMQSFELMQKIQECIGTRHPVITTEVGQHQAWAARYLKFDRPRKFITSGGLGTMGFGFPSAIGASVALGKEPVICIAGDGSIQMNIQELATCMDYGIPVKVFIFDNGYLGMVRQFQERMCAKRYSDTKISNPDFIKFAQSYGAKGIRVEKLEDVKSAIAEAFDFEGPVFIDFVIEPEEVL